MLVTSLTANAVLDSVQHRVCVRKAGTDARKEKVEKEKEALKLMSEGASKKTKKRLDRISLAEEGVDHKTTIQGHAADSATG